MSKFDFFIKRVFDILLSLLGLIFFSPVILISMLISRLDTGASGLFKQERVGRGGKLFYVYKLRTMVVNSGPKVTVVNDTRITNFGIFFRRWKIDELPQLWNVLIGQMSLVGPRPDVSGYADKLEGEYRAILTLRPGITGPASIKYRNEESILLEVDDPIEYNDIVIWPDKVKINFEYLKNWSLISDIKYIFRTIR